MTAFDAEAFDVAVIGAGHAGIEAALASARLGAKTACFSINLDAVGNMPCNPAIGGTAKGHLVREIDALGGEMARAADAACIQYRMLNRGKGPAVHSLRAQADRIKYRAYMKHVLEQQENLFLMQDEVVAIEQKDGAVSAIVTAVGVRHAVKAVVVASGTFLGGRVIIGEYTRESGPDGMAAAKPLTESLRGLGLRLQRFKTGTPPRINRRSIDFEGLAVQEGEDEIIPFSFETDHPPDNRAVCHLTYTTAETHEIIRANLDRSPLYGGKIEGVGPRYCPSIEDKVVRFADKPRHQLFLEPMGLDTEEIYVQGFSSSMPFDVQRRMLHSVKGLEHAEIMRPAYAIEYDCVDPTELLPTLESKKVAGLYGAGQFNGSSGYEEAAVQGFVAGNQANNFGVAFHQFAFCKCEGTSKADVETNRFQRVNAHQAEIQFFLQLAQANGHSFTVNGVGTFAQQMPVAGHFDQLIVIAGDPFRTFLDLLVGDDIVKHNRRIVNDITNDMSIGTGMNRF